MGQLHRDNRFDRMTDSFRQLVGRAPISAAEFARRHADVFTPQSERSKVTAEGVRKGDDRRVTHSSD
jgi:hypothetical protein